MPRHEINRVSLAIIPRSSMTKGYRSFGDDPAGAGSGTDSSGRVLP